MGLIALLVPLVAQLVSAAVTEGPTLLAEWRAIVDGSDKTPEQKADLHAQMVAALDAEARKVAAVTYVDDAPK